MKKPVERLVVQIPPELKHQLRILAAVENTTIRAIVQKLIIDALQSDKKVFDNV